MQGIWLAIATNQHPLAYDPAVGRVGEGQCWQVGAIVAWNYNDSARMPDLGKIDGFGARFYRWQFYAGKTIEDVMAYLPMGVERKPESVKGGLRLKLDNDPAVRPGSDLGLDIKFNGDKR